MIEVVVTTEAPVCIPKTGAISRTKLQSNHHNQRSEQTNIQFFYRPDALSYVPGDTIPYSTDQISL